MGVRVALSVTKGHYTQAVFARHYGTTTVPLFSKKYKIFGKYARKSYDYV